MHVNFTREFLALSLSSNSRNSRMKSKLILKIVANDVGKMIAFKIFFVLIRKALSLIYARKRISVFFASYQFKKPM